MIYPLSGGGFQFSNARRTGLVSAQPSSKQGMMWVTAGAGSIDVTPAELREIGEAMVKAAGDLATLARAVWPCGQRECVQCATNQSCELVPKDGG